MSGFRCYQDCGKHATFVVKARRVRSTDGQLGATHEIATVCDEHLVRGVWDLRHASNQADDPWMHLIVTPIVEP